MRLQCNALSAAMHSRGTASSVVRSFPQNEAQLCVQTSTMKLRNRFRTTTVSVASAAALHLPLARKCRHRRKVRAFAPATTQSESGERESTALLNMRRETGTELPFRKTSAALRGNERTADGEAQWKHAMEQAAYCALDSDAEGVQQQLEQLDAAGIRPGAEAWHALIASLCAQLDAEGAVRAAWDAHAEGEALLPQTYADLLRAFLASSPSSHNTDDATDGSKAAPVNHIRAAEAIDALERCGDSWWCSAACSLFRFGHTQDARALVQRHMHSSKTASNNYDRDDESQNASMPKVDATADNLEPQTSNRDSYGVHEAELAGKITNITALLYCEHLAQCGEYERAIAFSKCLSPSGERASRLGALRGLVQGEGSTNQALEVLSDMPAGGRSDEPYATALEVLLRNSDGYQLEHFEVDSLINQLEELMTKYNVQQGAEWLCKCVEARIRSGDAERAADCIIALGEGGSGFLGTRVSMQTAGIVVQGLSALGSGERLASVLESLAAEDLALPARVKATDSHGRTLATRWLLADEVGKQVHDSNDGPGQEHTGSRDENELDEEAAIEFIEKHDREEVLEYIFNALEVPSKMKAIQLREEIQAAGHAPYRRKKEDSSFVKQLRSSLAESNDADEVLLNYVQHASKLYQSGKAKSMKETKQAVPEVNPDDVLRRLHIGMRLLEALSTLAAPPSPEDVKQLMLLASAANASDEAAQLLEHWSNVLDNQQLSELARKAESIRQR